MTQSHEADSKLKTFRLQITVYKFNCILFVYYTCSNLTIKEEVACERLTLLCLPKLGSNHVCIRKGNKTLPGQWARLPLEILEYWNSRKDIENSILNENNREVFNLTIVP